VTRLAAPELLSDDTLFLRVDAVNLESVLGRAKCDYSMWKSTGQTFTVWSCSSRSMISQFTAFASSVASMQRLARPKSKGRVKGSV